MDRVKGEKIQDDGDDEYVDVSGDLLYERGLEDEITHDVALVQNQRMRRFHQKEEYQDYGPVEFRFDSTQRKKQVIVHNSNKYEGRASEWYFARKNNTTANETYRCVQCRRYREEVKKKRRTLKEERPEARIIVQKSRFLTDPDAPLGDHICEFETNERTLLESVWCRRALSKANSELRKHAVKPKQKFDMLVEEIRNGHDYAHLPDDVRDKIIKELTDPKRGFAARRRSFARNNRYAIQRQRENGEYVPDDGEQYAMRPNCVYFICGMPDCGERFVSSEDRLAHRQDRHPDVWFIDDDKDLEEYAQYRASNAIVDGEELFVADEQVVSGDVKMEYDDQNEWSVVVPDDLNDHQNAYVAEYVSMLCALRDEVNTSVALDEPMRNSLIKQFGDFVTQFKKQIDDAQPTEAPA